MKRNLLASAAAQARPAATIEPISTTIEEVARLTGLSVRSVYRELAAGNLAAVKRGRTTLVMMDSVRRYMASLPAANYAANRDKAA